MAGKLGQQSRKQLVTYIHSQKNVAMNACVLVFDLYAHTVQDPLPGKWYHLRWTGLPIPVNVTKITTHSHAQGPSLTSF